jgi:hypothetical protein
MPASDKCADSWFFEKLLLRETGVADVEDKCDASAAQRPDEGVGRFVIVANGANRRQAASGGSRITEMGERW